MTSIRDSLSRTKWLCKYYFTRVSLPAAAKNENNGAQILCSKSSLAVPIAIVRIFTQKYSARRRADAVIGKKCSHIFIKKLFTKRGGQQTVKTIRVQGFSSPQKESSGK